MLPGTGFTIVPGAMSKIQDGGMGQKLSVPFNLSADPFIPDGTRIHPDNETARKLKLARYFGGDESKWNWVAQGDYSETRTWRPGRVLRGFLLAWKAGHDVNSWSKVFKLVGSPSDYSSSPPAAPDAAWPTVREQTDYEFAFTRDESQQWYEALLDMGFIEDAPKPGEVGDGTGANTRPTKPIKQPPNTVPPVVPPNVPPSTPPAVPPGVPPAVNPIPLLEQLLSQVKTLATALDSQKAALEDIRAGQGRAFDRLADLRDETTHQGKQLDVLVRRSKPERGSSGGGGAKGEVKRKN